MKIKENSKKIIYGVFILFFLIMLLFNFLTPLAGDDIAHYFGMTGEHCGTVSEMIRDMSALRNEVNGRVLAHFFVYFFLNLPKIIFDIVNALMAVLVIYLAYRFFRGKDDFRNLIILLSFIFLWWVFAPSFGKVYLWLTGSCNYLWNLVLDLLVIYPFFCEYAGKEHKESPVLLFLAAFIAGTYSENGAVATIAVIGLLTIAIWIKNRKFPVLCFLVCLAALAGFFVLMSAPSEIGGKSDEASSFAANLITILRKTRKHCLIVYLIYFAELVLCLVLKKDKRRIIFTLILFFAGLLSIFVFIFAIYIPPRSFNISVFLTTLGIAVLLAELWESSSKAVLIASGLALLVFIPIFISGSGDILSLYLQSNRRYNAVVQATQQGMSEVSFPRYASRTMYTAVIIEDELEESPECWYNDLLAKYYGFEKVYGEIE